MKIVGRRDHAAQPQLSKSSAAYMNHVLLFCNDPSTINNDGRVMEHGAIGLKQIGSDYYI